MVEEKQEVRYKFCHSCQNLKSISDFNKNKARSDGLQTQCKSCHNEMTRKYNHSPRGKVAVANAVSKYQKTDKWRLSHLKKVVEDTKKNPDKYLARQMVNRAVRKGLIPHPKKLHCNSCGEAARHYHHYNGYNESNIFDIIPVCAKCHVGLHHG